LRYASWAAMSSRAAVWFFGTMQPPYGSVRIVPAGFSERPLNNAAGPRCALL
jgi:hypothetical protein